MKNPFRTLIVGFIITFLLAYLTTHREIMSRNNFKGESNINVVDTLQNVTDTLQNAVSANISNQCSICGRTFYNRGYEEGLDGVWRELEEGNQGQICSPACGERHNQQFNAVAKKYGVDLEDSESNSTNSDEYKMGNDGRIYEQNRCSLCKGTGIETGRNIATGETEGRICPMCEGRGVRSY